MPHSLPLPPPSPPTEPPLSCHWISSLDVYTARSVVALVDSASGDGGTLGYPAPMTEAEAEDFIFSLQRRVAAGEAHVLVGWVGHRMAFMVVLSPSGMANCRHRAELSKGVVHPEFRGRHLVERALCEILAKAEALRVEQLVLDVREGCRAHRLWQHHGFETFGVLEDYARVEGTTHRGHFMVQSVAALRARLQARRSTPLPPPPGEPA
jgi:ribosomal protein S18 acetylase RimI-like enzyme